MKTVSLLSKMELVGVGVSTEKLQELATLTRTQCFQIEKRAHQLAGRNFSLSSTKDIASILGMNRGIKRSSTNKKALEQHSEDPVANLIIEWRKLNCMLTKMIYPLLRIVENGRIHGRCITHNVTGRISMHEPNLQNVARDFDVHDAVTNEHVVMSCRNAFVTLENYSLISADYRQLELRLLAHLSGDKLLRETFQLNRGDVFKTIAAKLNGVTDLKVIVSNY